jgi:Tol biopolymer transport system component
MNTGENIAGYRIRSPLGAGGMGEVWRAEDEKLGREVALKVLPEDVAGDPDRLARLEREAKMLASLNHTNIAHLYGLETVTPDTSTAQGAGTATFLVMELVEGEDLSERIGRGPIPVDEAIPIALQIAEALEAAHEQNIVHRDLKPANIKLKGDGAVKVLDFGLAKAWEAESADHSLSMSPTMTQHATAAGIILGTAGYMAPEQAAGLGTDTRADIWSFGVVLWEMLTGVKLFEGETVSHVLAAVLKDEPDLRALPESTPPQIAELIGRCLRKKPKMRIQAIGDVRIALEEYLADPDAATPLSEPRGVGVVATPMWRRAVPWAAAVALGLALVVVAVSRPEVSARVVKATVPPPSEMRFDLRPAAPGPAAVSPDGEKIAFTATDDSGRARVFVRHLDAGEAYVLSGTEGAQYPFWAPDSRWLGFFTQPDDLLRKIDTTGGPPITLCDAPNGKGGTWSADGVIVFAPNAGSPLMRVPSAGGEPVEITTIDTDRHNSHRLPWFLPDGRHFLFVARGMASDESAVMIGSLDDDETHELMRNQSQAAFASGRLLFVRDQTLMAQPFSPDERMTTGEAVPVAEDVLVIPGASLAVFGVSQEGVLTFQTGSAETSTTLEWRDRAGNTVGELGDPALYRVVALSPDGSSVATQIVEIEGGTFDIWIYEVERNIRTRFTFDPASDTAPVWSADGSEVFFASDRDVGFDVFRKPLSGVGEVELVHSGEGNSFPESVSPDGKFLCVLVTANATADDLMLVPLDGDGEPTIFRQTEFNESGARISPDGRWIVYHSDESGDFEVYVTTFPVAGRRWQVSSGNGVYPEWRADGGEIVYSDFAGGLIAVEVDGSGETFRVGAAEPLFASRPPEAGGSFYTVSTDNQRFLVIPDANQQADTLLNLVVNWPAEIEVRR